MKRPSLLRNAAAVLALTLGSAQAVVLSPTDDTSGTLTFAGTTVTKRTHTSANGTSGSLPVSKTRNAMIRFEVGSSVLSSAEFRQARLTLYVSSRVKAGDISVHVFSQDWDEIFADKSRTMPTFDSAFTTIPAVSVLKGQFVVLDVTAEVRAAVNSSGIFHVALSSPDGVVNALISSKESTLHAPQLELVPRGFLTPGNSPFQHNTAGGVLSMGSVTTGEGNTAFGKEAMVAQSTGYYNTALGYLAMRNALGNGNTATGYATLENNGGNGNTANGYSAMRIGTTGSDNTAIGYFALANNTADKNTAVGYRALLVNTSGSRNTAIGNEALKANTTGYANTAIGYSALASNTTGEENTASGFGALYSNTTGVWNTAFGLFALRENTTGYLNTAIGFYAGRYATAFQNTTCVGFDAQATQSNEIRLGNNDITRFSCRVGLTISSDRTLKENFLPVDGAEVLEKIKAMPMTSWNYIGHDAKKERHYGPMAQDFYEAFGTDAMGTIGSPTTVNTNDMAGVTFSAIQQLTKENEALRDQQAEQELQFQQLHEKLEKLNARLEGLIE
jgi:hypothetical protein